MIRLLIYVMSISLLSQVCCGQLDEILGPPHQRRPKLPLSRKPVQVDPMLRGQWFLCKRGPSIQACRHNQSGQRSSSSTDLDLFSVASAPRQTTAPCTPESCAHGTCSNERCLCEAGWKGKYCSNDVNECGKKSGPCSHICTNTPGSYICRCRERYALDVDQHTCTPTNAEPSESITRHAAPDLAQLYSRLKSQVKSTKLQRKRQAGRKLRKRIPSRATAISRQTKLPRPPPRTTNNSQSLASLIDDVQVAGMAAMHSIGRFLNKVKMVKRRISPSKLKGRLGGNPCSKARCHHKCVINSKNRPMCVCRLGYFWDRTRRRCYDRNECASERNPCQENSTCYNKLGAYSCKCNVGYILSSNSSKSICQDINECLTGDHICTDQSVCINMPGFYRCKCVEGYTGNGINCSPDGSRGGLAIHQVTDLLNPSSEAARDHIRQHLSSNDQLTL